MSSTVNNVSDYSETSFALEKRSKDALKGDVSNWGGKRKHNHYYNIRHAIQVICSTDGFYGIAGMLLAVNQLRCDQQLVLE